MVSSSSSLLRSLGKALLPWELWIQEDLEQVGAQGRGWQDAPERAHLLPGEQEALLSRARLRLQYLQLHLQL